MSDTPILNDKFALEGSLNFIKNDHGMLVAEVNTALCQARIALQGAQLLTWTPAGEQPVIWLSDEAVFKAGKSLRGGIPVCWPWFGAHSTEAGFPAHGFARTVLWQVKATQALPDDRVKIEFRLDEAEFNQTMWPYHCELELHMTLGRTLELALITRNSDTQPFTITEALHTYFAVSDVRKIRVQGLDGCEYLDKVTDFSRKRQSGAVTFAEEVDRVYLATEAECVIDDTPLKRRIHITKRGSHSTVVWNPWQAKAAAMGDLGEAGYLAMLCVETANAAENRVNLNPGEEHCLWVSYHVEH